MTNDRFLTILLRGAGSRGIDLETAFRQMENLFKTEIHTYLETMAECGEVDVFTVDGCGTVKFILTDKGKEKVAL